MLTREQVKLLKPGLIVDMHMLCEGMEHAGIVDDALLGKIIRVVYGETHTRLLSNQEMRDLHRPPASGNIEYVLYVKALGGTNLPSYVTPVQAAPGRRTMPLRFHEYTVADFHIVGTVHR